tara:strand:+ start:21750 stop:22235 length:486 start_codon:yes stop_codon:yes gene_type:complete
MSTTTPHNSETDTSYKRPRPLKRRNVLERSSRFGPNMTPMVDVTLVILIFFMASATIAGPEWFLRAQLPAKEDPNAAVSDFALPTPMLSAELYLQDNEIMVRGLGSTPRSLETVVEQIRTMDESAAAGLILGIRSTDEVPYWAVVMLHDAGASVSMRVAIR